MVKRLNDNTPARNAGYQNIQYIRKDFTYADNGSVLLIGTLPADAIILKPLSGVQINVAFNAGSTNVADIGTSATGDLFATDLALGTIGFVPIDEVVTEYISSDTSIYVTPQLSGTAASAGSGVAVVAFIPKNS